MINPGDLSIPMLGHCMVESPIQRFWADAHEMNIFVSDEDRILLNDSLGSILGLIPREESGPASFELAGPHRKLFFDPASSSCAIVTCGGLCPGINDVIRGIVMQACLRYGVRTIFGIQYGYEGLIRKYEHSLLNLTPASVENIHSVGGSVLGTSRGPQDAAQIVERLRELNIKMLFIIGGDGTLRGANRIADEARRLHYPIFGSWHSKDHRQRYNVHR